MTIRRKQVHVSVGMDGEGDACLYFQHVDAEGETTGYVSEADLEKLADELNDHPDSLFEV